MLSALIHTLLLSLRTSAPEGYAPRRAAYRLDDDELAGKLKELNLGIETKTVEQVEVNEDWLRNI